MAQFSRARIQADALCLILLALVAFGVTAWHMRMPTLGLQDDAFYYLKIAQNLAQGAGSTFDGINPTNGYQPLWLLLLVPVFRVAPTNADALLLTYALQGFFYAGMLLAIYLTLRLRTGIAAALFGALLWAIWESQESFKGMEFSVHALLVGIIGLLYLKWFTLTSPVLPRRYLVLGILSSLAFLARLDTLLLGFLLALALGAQNLAAKNFSLQPLLLFLSPIALVACAYAIVNLYFFGHLTPISGVIKTEWSQTLLASDPLFLSNGWFAAKLNNVFWIFNNIRRSYPLSLFIGTFGALALWLAQFLPLVPINVRASLASVLNPLTPFIVYSVLAYLAYALLFHASQSWSPWYYVVQPWLAVLLIAYALETVTTAKPLSWLRDPRVATYSAAAVALVMLVILARQLWLLDQNSQIAVRDAPLLQGAAWANANLAPDAVIGSWNAGAVGFLSERRTINLDGLVNSYTFFETNRHDLCAYWKQHKVTHLIDVFGGDNALDVVPTLPAYASCLNALRPVWSIQYPGATWRLQVYSLALQ